MDFVAIDFETANNKRSSVCSMGLAFVERGKLVRTEHFYIKPTPNYFDSFNTNLHGISDKLTNKEKTFGQHWEIFKEYFENKTLIAHNAAFDFSVLRSILDECNFDYPDLDYHCTLRLSKVALPLKQHILSDVANYFKINLQHHNAESDAKVSALIALKLCDKFKVCSIEELTAKFGFSPGRICSKTRTYKPYSKQ